MPCIMPAATLYQKCYVFLLICRWHIIGVGTGGGKGALAPSLSREGGGGGRRSPPPHFWGRTYLKIPPRVLFFHPHNSTVLTPNQSVRCFETFIGVGTGGAGDPAPPVFLQCVCGGGGGGPSCWKPLRASFSVSSDIIFCIISDCVYQSKNKP